MVLAMGCPDEDLWSRSQQKGILSNTPKVSVILPIKNAEKYLAHSIQSILNQTFSDFELIIINDSSTDQSLQILSSIQDDRIRLIHLDPQQGIAAALNKGISISKGDYIARMDADDISVKTRLEKQVRFLNENLEIGVLGSWIKLFGELPRTYIHKYPVLHDEIRACMLFENSIGHPTVMFRREIWLRCKLLYSDECKYAEDWDLWFEFSKVTILHNLPEVLLHYRVHVASSSICNSELQSKSSCIVQKKFFDFYGLPYDIKFASTNLVYSLKMLQELFQYLSILKQLNTSINSRIFERTIDDLFWKSMSNNKSCNLQLVKFAWTHSLSSRSALQLISYLYKYSRNCLAYLYRRL